MFLCALGLPGRRARHLGSFTCSGGGVAPGTPVGAQPAAPRSGGRQGKAGLGGGGRGGPPTFLLARIPRDSRARRVRGAAPPSPVLRHREPALSECDFEERRKSLATSCRGCESRSEVGARLLRALAGPAAWGAHSRNSNHRLAGVQAVSASVVFNSKGALGSRAGCGQPGSSDRPHDVQEALRGK